MKKILIILLYVFVLYSCATTALNKSVKKVELGMTKKEIVKIMGKTYNSSGAVKTPEGNLETIKYTDTTTSGYTFHFLNDKLVKWNEGTKNQYPSRPRRH